MVFNNFSLLNQPPIKIAFASCVKYDAAYYQNAWQCIRSHNPDLLLLLGDIVYNRVYDPPWYDYDTLKRRFGQQFSVPGFKRLLDTVPYHLAVWDDHDFAFNDVCGADQVSWTDRRRSRKLFLDNMAKEDREERPNVYYCKDFDNGRIRVIMLDVRFYRQLPGYESDLLGEKQRNWLKEKLQHNGRFTLICSGSCFSYGSDLLQSWMNYGKWATEFSELLKSTPHPLFISGDIHRNEFQAHPDSPFFPFIAKKPNAHTAYRKWLSANRAKLGPTSEQTALRWSPFDINFFEIISSGIGRPTSVPGELRDNYGIMDITNDRITVNFYGRHPDNRSRVVIDVNTWRCIYNEPHPNNVCGLEGNPQV